MMPLPKLQNIVARVGRTQGFHPICQDSQSNCQIRFMVLQLSPPKIDKMSRLNVMDISPNNLGSCSGGTPCHSWVCLSARRIVGFSARLTSTSNPFTASASYSYSVLLLRPYSLLAIPSSPPLSRVIKKPFWVRNWGRESFLVDSR